jgi:hypothetical protein
MSRALAIIEGGIVANVIVADSWPGGIDITDLTPRPGPGWTYDGQSFAPPAPSVPVVQTTTKMTHLGFLDRMQPDEWARFEGLLSQSAEARFAKAKFDVARDVDVARADVQTFAQTLRAVGVLLTDERVTALLAPIPVDSPHALP